MINFLRGYYTITVEGIGSEKFLNHIIRNNINIYNVIRINNVKIQFQIDRQDFRQFKNIYRGNNFDVKIKQSTGIPFIAKRIYKYKGMVICAVISLFLLMMTSQFVTDIYIQTPEGIKEEEVRKELYQAGLKPGLYKKNIQRKEIREYIMKKFDDVAYVSINVSGTNVFVNITKKAETLESTEESNYCNIIAQKSGIIEKVIARSGNSVVNVGDIIQKGDMLITGANSKSIPEVWASTFYEVKKSASYIETQSEKTGEKKNVYTLSFYDKSYTIRRNIKYDNYIIENKEHKLSIKDYTFPVKIGVSTFYETVNTKVEKDKEELKEELSNQVLKELEYIIPASAKIVDVSHKHNVNNGLLEYSITVTASENIIQVYPLTKAQAQEFIEQESTQEEESVPINPDKIPKTDIRNELNNDKRLEEWD